MAGCSLSGEVGPRGNTFTELEKVLTELVMPVFLYLESSNLNRKMQSFIHCSGLLLFVFFAGLQNQNFLYSIQADTGTKR